MRPVEHLAMNQGELRRKADEACTIIDLVAPFVEHGKGGKLSRLIFFNDLQ